MGPGQPSTLTGQRSTRTGSQRSLAGSGWAGLGRAGPDTWHAVALPRRCHGPPLGLVHRHGPQWTQALVYGGPRLLPVNRVHPSFLLSVVYVYRVQARAAGEEGFLCFPPSVFPPVVCSPMSLPQRRWRPIEVGKSFARPWRTQWWGLGGDWGFLGHWPRWSVARRCSPVVRSRM